MTQDQDQKLLEAIEASFGWTDEEREWVQSDNDKWEAKLLSIKALRMVLTDKKFKLLGVASRDLVREALAALE
jgi:hypothetical protein